MMSSARSCRQHFVSQKRRKRPNGKGKDCSVFVILRRATERTHVEVNFLLRNKAFPGSAENFGAWKIYDKKTFEAP